MENGIHLRRRDASDCEGGRSMELSATATPQTPDPLFSSLEVDTPSIERNSSSGNVKCFPINKRRAGQPYACLISCKAPKDSLIRKMGAEFIGTFMIVFIAVAGPITSQRYNGGNSLILDAVSTGLAVLVAVLSTGHISAAHFNPSVSIALALFGQFPWAHVPGYILAQVLASLCASSILKGIFHPITSLGITAPSLDIIPAFVVEFIITFFLLFVITAVAKDSRAEGEFAAIGISSAVLFGILVAGPLTGASMNPARTLGPAIVSGSYKAIWVYMFAPVLGAIAGVGAYMSVMLREDEAEPEC